jgi:membrane protein involved in colicin uptake
VANSVEELIGTLNDLVQDAWSLPLGADKCVLERDKILDILEEMSAQLPGEIKQAKTIVESRNDVLNNAKREAEKIRRQAEEYARAKISEEQIVKEAEAQAAEMIANAQAKIRELRDVTNKYVADSLKSCEDAVEKALEDVRITRGRFDQLSAPKTEQAPQPAETDDEL